MYVCVGWSGVGGALHLVFAGANALWGNEPTRKRKAQERKRERESKQRTGIRLGHCCKISLGPRAAVPIIILTGFNLNNAACGFHRACLMLMPEHALLSHVPLLRLLDIHRCPRIPISTYLYTFTFRVVGMCLCLLIFPPLSSTTPVSVL